MSLILRYLKEQGKHHLEEHASPDGLSCTLLTPRFYASGHVIGLIFAGHSSEPILVAKIPRLPHQVDRIEREAANLSSIQASRPMGFDSIPRLLALDKFEGNTILLETALNGAPMDQGTIRSNPANYSSALLEWVTQVHLATCTASTDDHDYFERLVESPLRYFEQVFPLSEDEYPFLDCSWEILEQLRSMNFPLVFEHGDLSHPNVIRLAGYRPGVLDWEQADPYGLPACDLYFFLTYVAFSRRRAHKHGTFVPAVQEAFFERQAWAKPYVKTYADRLNVPISALTPLFVLVWLRYIVRLLQSLSDNDVGTAIQEETARWLRGNRYYALWQYAALHANELAWDD